jgi:hypothetical protein
LNYPPCGRDDRANTPPRDGHDVRVGLTRRRDGGRWHFRTHAPRVVLYGETAGCEGPDMTTKLTLAIFAALLGGCAIVPVGYDDGYYHRYHRDRYYGERDDYRYDRWRGHWRDDGDRYYSRGVYYRNWDHGQ